MALASYSDLQASIAGWCNRTDLTAVIPDFVALGEARIARDLRARGQVVTSSVSTVAGTQYVTLPSDFLELENLTLTSTTPPGALSVVTPEILDRKFPEGYQTGQPQVYTIIGNLIHFGPTPDAVYTVELDYYARIPALATASTNWLLTGYPMVYLSASMAAASMYLKDEPRAQMWEATFRDEITRLQSADDAALRSGSIMRVRAL